MSDVQISARIPREHAQELDRRAKADDRTVSAELRRAIRSYLATPRVVDRIAWPTEEVAEP